MRIRRPNVSYVYGPVYNNGLGFYNLIFGGKAIPHATAVDERQPAALRVKPVAERPLWFQDEKKKAGFEGSGLLQSWSSV